MVTKPKRIGTHVIDYSKFGDAMKDSHPVYEYRGFFIVRGTGIAHGKTFHYDIYRSFENGKPSAFDFDLNREPSFRRLEDAAGIIDNYLERKNIWSD